MEHNLELVAGDLSFPTSLTFDDEENAYIAESGLPFGGAPPGGRIWKLAPDGTRSLLAQELRPPVNGLTFHRGSLYVSEGGHPSRISRLDQSGDLVTLLDHLPGPGNYQTNMVAFGPDEKMYFSQGAMTNTGVVGLDAYEIGWLRRLPHAHDLPGLDIELAGVNFETPDPVSGQPDARAVTGAFVPFGVPTESGQLIHASLPCTAAVMRCHPDGNELELVAWGLRNAFALGFLPDGRLIAVDQGADDRGSRPVGNAPDVLFEVKQGAWCGWPDFINGDAITDPKFRPERGPAPTFVLEHRELPLPERGLLEFPAHAAAVKFAVVPPDAPNWAGEIVIALFGDERPMTAPSGPRVGRSVARINPKTWSLQPFIGEPLVRPIDVQYNPKDQALYILDFGQFEMLGEGNMRAEPKTGRLWRTKGQ